jgi:hypothetical protein
VSRSDSGHTRDAPTRHAVILMGPPGSKRQRKIPKLLRSVAGEKRDVNFGRSEVNPQQDRDVDRNWVIARSDRLLDLDTEPHALSHGRQ